MVFFPSKFKTEELIEIYENLTSKKNELFEICKKIDADINKSSINPISDQFWEILLEIQQELGKRQLEEIKK